MESKCACREYVVASGDPRRGSVKKREVFIALVLGEYRTIIAQTKQSDGVTYVERIGDAIFHRFRKSRFECLKSESIIN